jgi:hypothetical protein
VLEQFQRKRPKCLNIAFAMTRRSFVVRPGNAASDCRAQSGGARGHQIEHQAEPLAKAPHRLERQRPHRKFDCLDDQILEPMPRCPRPGEPLLQPRPKRRLDRNLQRDFDERVVLVAPVSTVIFTASFDVVTRISTPDPRALTSRASRSRSE